MMDPYKQALQATDSKKQALDDDILHIRDLYKQQLKRHNDLLARQTDLMNINGGSNIQASDVIHLNVGGTKMHILRETLTLIKGSRLEVLFSGRWESKLLRDEEGCVFFDVDPLYFKKIVEYLYSVKLFQEWHKQDDTGSQTSQSDQPQLPTFEDPTDQAVFDLYVDFFRLSKVDCCEVVTGEEITVPAAEDGNSYDDLIGNEKEELIKVQTKLDEMEQRLEEEESFVSFFTTSEQVNPDDNSASDDGISFTTMTSDLDSNHSLEAVKADIINLSINNDIIPVKLSTLLSIKGSLFFEKFSSQEWIEKHTFTGDNGRDLVLIEYPVDAFKIIINQLRLMAVMGSTSMESVPLMKKNRKIVKTVDRLVATLFKGNEEKFVNKVVSFHESVILDSNDGWENQIMTWLDKADCDDFEPKMLYQASRDGWSTSEFHSKCDNQGPTLTVVRTSEGYVFGGFTDKPWSNRSNVSFVSSNEAFLFGLHCYGESNPIKMEMKSDRSTYAMYCHSNNGPAFGSGHDLRIGNNNDLKTCYSNLGHTYSLSSGTSNTFFTGDRSFTPTEVEVFQV